MKRTTKGNLFAQVTICTTTGLLIALPFLAVSPRMASAKQYPAERHSKQHDRDNRDSNRTRGTMYATVTKDLGGNRFEVRADDNRLFTVRSRHREPRHLRVGDRVLLEGYINKHNVFIAESVRRVDDGNSSNASGRIAFYGTVVTVASSTRVIVRADDGRNFTVSSSISLSRAITRGDRVRVNGNAAKGNNVRSATVTLVTNSDNSTPANQTVTFNGTVLNSDSRGGNIQVRGDSGQTYNVRPNNNSTFNRGERVHIVGRYRNGTVYATSINRL